MWKKLSVKELSWCGTEVYTFVKSNQTMSRLDLAHLGIWIGSQIMVECLAQPAKPGNPEDVVVRQ